MRAFIVLKRMSKITVRRTLAECAQFLGFHLFGCVSLTLERLEIIFILVAAVNIANSNKDIRSGVYKDFQVSEI